MEMLTHWDASALLGERPYEKMLNNPDEASEICPPSLQQLDAVLAARRVYADAHIDRKSLAQALRDSHQRRGAPPSSLHSIEQLENPHCFLIIAGQQPGLLGGPLYTFYKILHAVALAERLTRERREVFAPALWDASEDHDFSEISVLQWLTKDRETATFQWPDQGQKRRPFFQIPLRECPIEEILRQIRESTHPTEFAEEVFEKIRSSADGAETAPDFFDRLMWRIFENDGLIIIRPDDLWMRRQAIPLFDREIRNPLRTTKGIERIGLQLMEQGLSPQIHKRADRTSFFLIEEGERRPVFAPPHGFAVDGIHTNSESVLLNRLEKKPESFSPSAVLRPVVQDALLPTAAAILGPSETAYHFLLQGVYEAHETPRPALVSRVGFTLIDRRESELMNRYDLIPKDWMENPAALVKRIVKEGSAENWKDESQASQAALEALFHCWKREAVQADPTIQKILDKNFARIQKDLKQSEDLLVRKIGEKHRQIQKHIEGLRHSLYPENTLQERRYNIFLYWMKFGPDILSGFQQIRGAIQEGAHVFLQIP
ncbi:MAG: bacillithiol biosynthesis cysteine-adding enzyme BshC [Candidatus Omnitrophica bacterium]|nr:bacillithiol biosynthesis cysteine-adding enzyme BshC [Candidatus Omnitrophota bacterium]